MPAFKDITGLRFGRLVVLEREGRNRWGNTHWLCRCDCGETKIVSSKRLIAGRAKSCGCLHREFLACNTKHGLCGTPTYKAWANMHARCGNPKHASYKNYGGRGRKVRYLSLDAFVADVGECPPGHDIHRKDNDRDYEPGNCEWLPREEHMRLHATRRTKYVPRLLDGPSPK